MPSSQVTTLSIASEPTLTNFYVAENRVAGLPKTKFNFNYYTGDPFVDYCNDTLVMALENLVLNKVVICQTTVAVEPFLLIFKRSVTRDYFSLSLPSPEDIGRVEECVIYILARQNKPLPTDELMDELITYILKTRDSLVNPWREIFRSVIESNYCDAWTSTYHKSIFGKKLEVILKPATEKALYDRRCNIEHRCARERNENVLFNELFLRIAKIVRQAMQQHWDEPDGGS